jgi:predicted dehydrogenase
MLNQEQPDGVILVTPYETILKIAVDVVNAGCAIMLEKPPGKNYNEYKALVKAIDRKNTMNLVAFNRRFMPLVKELTKWMSQDDIPFKLQHIDYKMYRVKRCESTFYATAVHGIDLVSYIAQSSYKNIKIHYVDMNHYGKGAANIEMQGDFKSGITTQLSFNPIVGIEIERIILCGDESTIFVDLPVGNNIDAPGIIRQYKDGLLLREKQGSEIAGAELIETNGFYEQLRQFLDCVRESKTTPNNIHSAMSSMKVTDFVRRRKTSYKATMFLGW